MNSNGNGDHAAQLDEDEQLAEKQELYDMCLEHLTDTHTQLWSRAWNISDPKAKRAAAAWLAEEISAVFA